MISGYADLLRRWGGEQPAVREEAVETIGREAQRMQRLVHDLLFLTRGAQGLALQPRRMDLGDVVAETVREARSLGSGREVADATRGVVPVDADFDRIKQLLWILLDNALKFTPPGGHVTARAAVAADGALLEVRDDGPGMSPEVQAHACERFYRADPARTAGGGAGLGLTIAREIAVAHCGRLEIDSAAGRGTAVRLHLPLAAEPSPEKEEPTAL